MSYNYVPDSGGYYSSLPTDTYEVTTLDALILQYERTLSPLLEVGQRIDIYTSIAKNPTRHASNSQDSSGGTILQ